MACFIEEVSRRIGRRDDAEIRCIIAIGPATTDVNSIAHRLTARPADGDAHGAAVADIHVAVAVAEHVRQHDYRRPAADGLASVAAEAGARGVRQAYGSVADAVDAPRQRLREHR